MKVYFNIDNHIYNDFIKWCEINEINSQEWISDHFRISFNKEKYPNLNTLNEHLSDDKKEENVSKKEDVLPKEDNVKEKTILTDENQTQEKKKENIIDVIKDDEKTDTISHQRKIRELKVK